MGKNFKKTIVESLSARPIVSNLVPSSFCVYLFGLESLAAISEGFLFWGRKVGASKKLNTRSPMLGVAFGQKKKAKSRVRPAFGLQLFNCSLSFQLYRRPKAPASAVNWKGHTTHTHSGKKTRKASIATVDTKNIIQSRPLFWTYSSFFMF